MSRFRSQARIRPPRPGVGRLVVSEDYCGFDPIQAVLLWAIVAGTLLPTLRPLDQAVTIQSRIAPVDGLLIIGIMVSVIRLFEGSVLQRSRRIVWAVMAVTAAALAVSLTYGLVLGLVPLEPLINSSAR